MNAALVDGIVKAVLYEGYMLYPYRPSAVKNQQRFNFGVVYPRAYSEARAGPTPGPCKRNALCKGATRRNASYESDSCGWWTRSIEKLQTPSSELCLAFK